MFLPVICLEQQNDTKGGTKKNKTDNPFIGKKKEKQYSSNGLRPDA